MKFVFNPAKPFPDEIEVDRDQQLRWAKTGRLVDFDELAAHGYGWNIDYDETYVSWCDDGVTIQCERDACNVDGRWWRQVVTESPLTPDALERALLNHVKENH